ncbi:MAG: P-loop containing nucleoside triphosphate hydrolase protein [Olpidium bornovanus]|uniref:P-loop containing nucleoside triphosphate hydrolase protein n=1 Tax=Olpidium bornovanus TaxID=278681 RepID=A0A8H7ZX47_9FUNG|nr:MAG: P-loop containing nucleoside triphosphate hydrolase protein [Olpidium bornovanus]
MEKYLPPARTQRLLRPSNLLSRWLYLWVWPLAADARRPAADVARMGLELADSENATINADRLQAENPSVFRALKAAYGTSYLLLGLWKISWAFFTWLAAWYLLKVFLAYLQEFQDAAGVDSASPVPVALPTAQSGHLLAAAMFGAALLSSISIHQLYGQCCRQGMQIKAALTGVIYRKCLRSSHIRGGAGDVVNLLATDVTRVVDAVANFHFLWSAFVEAAVILVLAFVELGTAALPALAFVVLLLPVQWWLGRASSRLATESTGVTTSRVHLMSEILTAMKLIKFYAWEVPFSDCLDEIRAREMSMIRRNMTVKALNFMIVFAIPVFAALSSLAVWVFLLRRRLTPAVSFTALSLFNTLRYPFLMLPLAVSSTSAARIAFSRITRFLTSPEVEELTPLAPAPENPTAIRVRESDFRWDGEEKAGPTLSRISLEVKRGQIVAVIGDVGSGKTSLIAALMGQIRQVAGPKADVYGTTSYVPQEPWLLNYTLRDNIVFGSPFDRRRFDEVIRVCALQRDLSLLIAGENTEIAERGSNLSGGQKQRASIARAVYNDADTVLLDDPLSAVDQAVGRHIFQECFKTYLKGKTVVLAIHQLQYLSEVDHIVWMKEGGIAAQGSYEELMAGNPDFAHLITNHVVSDDDTEEESIEDELPKLASIDAADAQALLQQEPSADRHIKLVQSQTSAADLAHACEMNPLSITDRSQLLSRRAREINEMTISQMIERNQLSVLSGARPIVSHDVAEHIRKNELTVHSLPDVAEFGESDHRPSQRLVKEDKSSEASTGLYAKYAAAGRGATVAWLVKATALHQKMFRAVMNAPMAFFDSTPIGRILSAFSKHQLNIDDSMPNAAMQALQYAPLGLGAMILVSATIPMAWLPISVLAAAGLWVAAFASGAEKRFNNAEAMTKPAVISHFTASLEGLFSIRSFHAGHRFDRENLAKIDDNHRFLYAQLMTKSWTALALDVVTSLMVYFTCLLVVVYREAEDMDSIAGLGLSNALQMLVFVQWTVRTVGEIQGQMSSVGQLAYYGERTPREAPAELPGTITDAKWPQRGAIEFRDVVLKSHRFGVAVLKGVSFAIHPREKIGIVGRTGSGKSTLLISLLRIVEAHQGQILIDGLDVGTIGLRDLRTKIAIIPQVSKQSGVKGSNRRQSGEAFCFLEKTKKIEAAVEPVLFVGTVRSNLDPFNANTDEEVWRALDAVHLGAKIRGFTNGLQTAVIENGKNFSLGQRQVSTVTARKPGRAPCAVLSNTKILVLDEATAAIDMATDALIQQAIKDNFSDKTVLTIAHRLNTIIDSDKILCTFGWVRAFMDAGKVAEFGEPLALMNKRDGHFRGLVEQTGLATAAKLRDIAERSKSAREAAPPAAPAAPEPTAVPSADA